MTPPLTDEELAALELAIAGRGECAGPRTTFDGPDKAEVTILCGDNWANVVWWLAAAERDMPRLIAELRHHRSRLSAEDVEALRWARECIVRGLKRDSCYDADGNPPPGFTMISRALAVLERLCGGKEGV